MDNHKSDVPGISVALAMLGMLAIVGGAILAGYGRIAYLRDGYYSWGGALAYPASTFLISGVATGILFLGFAAVTNYLHGIHEYAKEIAHALRPEKED